MDELDKSEELESIGLGCALESFKEYEEIQSIINNLPETASNKTQSENVFQRFVYILNQYQEQPHLLDGHLDECLASLLSLGRNISHDKTLQHLAFKLLYIITKVRGYKVVIRHLPHEVSDVESVLQLLNEQDPQDCETWETRYMLLLWMSIIVIIPFHMTRLDDITDSSGKKPIMERIMILIKQYLSVGDKARDAAAFLASRFFTRPDVRSLYLEEYVQWCMEALSETDNAVLSGLSLHAGILSSLALLFKHGKREDIKDFGNPLLKKLLECGFKSSPSTTVRKMALKLLQRIGLSFLKVKVSEWRYNRGTRSLADNLAQGDNPGISIPLDLKLLPESEQNTEIDEEYDIPDEMEDVIDQLLIGLRDKDTILRWSAAKGIGRITSRLPKELADDIVSSVLDLLNFRESDASWHGGCLALAELARRGLILPQHLSKVVSVVLKALIYDEVRGNFSVGSHIRDAACYVCWSFARAYDPIVLQPYVNCIAGALLVTILFDREINCRRAASAAFQENVGRQGTFPHGIDILTIADYYAVGCRNNAYLNLSVFIGQFPEYVTILINHLLEYKINHWDSAIRELSAKALHNITALRPDYMREIALPKLLNQSTDIDLNTRHGALLSVAEIIHSLFKMSENEDKDILNIVGQSTFNKIRDIIFTLKEKKFFRGLGGVLTRIAACYLIEKASILKLPYQEEALIDLWQETIDSSLEHADVSVRSAAISALPHFCTCFYASNTAKGFTVFERYLANLGTNNLATRCGYTLAIGAFPKFLLQNYIPKVLNDLTNCVKIEEQAISWAEARRDAIKSLAEITANIGISAKNSLEPYHLETIFNAFLIGVNDYTVDSRGEIGAIVREAAMLAIQGVVILVVEEDPGLLQPYIMENIFKAILQQCVEKIDRTRSIAGTVFSSLLHNIPSVPHIPEYEKLLQVFSSEICDETNWASPSSTFHLFVKLLPLEKYTYNLLLGFTVSVGGLTESLVKYSRLSLVSYLKSLAPDDEILIRISNTLLTILKDHVKVDRILIPYIKMMDHLLVSGVELHLEKLSFNEQLVDLVWQASNRTGDAQKLIATIDLFSDLLQFSGSILQPTMIRLSILLCHRFPRIRILTSNKLYEAFVSYDILPNDVQDDVLTILSETDWNESVEKLRPIRNQICEKINIPVPTLIKPKA